MPTGGGCSEPTDLAPFDEVEREDIVSSSGLATFLCARHALDNFNGLVAVISGGQGRIAGVKACLLQRQDWC